MKRVKFSKLYFKGTSFFIIPTVGIKVVDEMYCKKFHLCFAWICFGLSICYAIKRSGGVLTEEENRIFENIKLKGGAENEFFNS